MVRALEPLRSEAFTEHQQAAFFHSRERRRSLAGIPELYRTHRVFGGGVMEVASLDTAALFPDRSRPITFQTAIEITGGAPSATVFSLGTATLTVSGSQITFTFGALTATFDNTVVLPIGLQLDLTVSVNPGAGIARLWGNGQELARVSSTPITEWSDGAVGSFATPVSDIIVLEPLSVYQGQKPRHMN